MTMDYRYSLPNAERSLQIAEDPWMTDAIYGKCEEF